eukprot:CFRG6643T1
MYGLGLRLRTTVCTSYKRLDDRLDTLQTLGEIWREYKVNFLVSSFLSLIMLLFAASLVFAIEGGEGEAFPTAGIALWWAIITSSTIGYGDYYPETTGGRLVGVALAWVGVAFFAIPAGILSSAFALKVERAGEVAERNRRKRLLSGQTVASWWRMRAIQARSEVSMNEMHRRLLTAQKKFYNELTDSNVQPDSIDEYSQLPPKYTAEYSEMFTHPYRVSVSSETESTQSTNETREITGAGLSTVKTLSEGEPDNIKGGWILVYMFGEKVQFDRLRRMLRDAIDEKEVGVADVLEKSKDMDLKLNKAITDVKSCQEAEMNSLKRRLAKQEQLLNRITELLVENGKHKAID